MKNFLLLLRWPVRAKNSKLFYLRGQAVDQVQSWIEEAWSCEIKRRIYAGWGPAIEWLKSRDAHILLLSGTPRPLAEPLMRHFRISDALCAEPEIVDQRYTGRLLRPHPKGRRKVDYAGAWLHNQGASWKEAIAVANDWPDRFLFDLSRPVVVRPNRRLQRRAAERRWHIVQNMDRASELINVFNLWVK